MEREWQELDIENVPSDLFKPGAWEFQESYINDDRWAFPFMGVVGVSLHGSRTEKYRIRRPKGWEPSECPRCGSRDNHICLPPCYWDHPHEWHDQPKAPTHEAACKNCRFYKSYGDRGECKRLSPTRISHTNSQWPHVNAHDWCGEWEAS